MENKQLIRQILGELADAECLYDAGLYDSDEEVISEECIKTKEKIEKYAKELGVEPPDFNWEIYILPGE